MKKIFFFLTISLLLFSCGKSAKTKRGLNGLWNLYMDDTPYEYGQSNSVEFSKGKAIWTQTYADWSTADTSIITVTYEDEYELTSKGSQIVFKNAEHYADGEATLGIIVSDNYIHIEGNIGTGCDGCYTKVTYWGIRME